MFVGTITQREPVFTECAARTSQGFVFRRCVFSPLEARFCTGEILPIASPWRCKKRTPERCKNAPPGLPVMSQAPQETWPRGQPILLPFSVNSAAFYNKNCSNSARLAPSAHENPHYANINPRGRTLTKDSKIIAMDRI